jgi:hypothetical protein
MNKEIKEIENQIRREIAREMLKNKEEKLLSFPFSNNTIEAVAEIVKLPEEETRKILQETILERWNGQLFKYLEDFFGGKATLWIGFASSEDEEEIIPDTLLYPWLKDRLQYFLSKAEKRIANN